MRFRKVFVGFMFKCGGGEQETGMETYGNNRDTSVIFIDAKIGSDAQVIHVTQKVNSRDQVCD